MSNNFNNPTNITALALLMANHVRATSGDSSSDHNTAIKVAGAILMLLFIGACCCCLLALALCKTNSTSSSRPHTSLLSGIQEHDGDAHHIDIKPNNKP